jgi:hypothetical protein
MSRQMITMRRHWGRGPILYRSASTNGRSPDGIALPDGFEIWQQGVIVRPEPAPEVFHGPIGEFSQKAGLQTQADPVAIHFQGLTLYGTCVGRMPHVMAGNDRHTAALHIIVVGRSAKGGKGTSYAVARELTFLVCDAIRKRIMSGFGSGEALILELALDPETGKPADDERLVVFEVEFGALLAKCRREGSTMAATVRAAWDGVPLANRTKGGGKLIADKHHIGAIGHITADELRLRMSDIDIVGGTANRWLHIWANKRPMDGSLGNVPQSLLTEYAGLLAANLQKVHGTTEVRFTSDAEALWKGLARRVDADDPSGLLGHVIGRAVPQCLRLALVYALADGQRVIDVDHVRAASAAWDYSRATAALIYGESTGDRRADVLLAALREAGADGMDSTSCNRELNNRPGAVKKARTLLETLGLAAVVKVPTGQGGTRQLMFAVRRSQVRHSRFAPLHATGTNEGAGTEGDEVCR